MGYKYNETEILDAAVQAALEDGLSRLTFGRLAKRLGIADRSIVYYFPTKADLLTQTIARIGGCLLYTSPSPRDRQKSRMPSSA